MSISGFNECQNHAGRPHLEYVQVMEYKIQVMMPIKFRLDRLTDVT